MHVPTHRLRCAACGHTALTCYSHTVSDSRITVEAQCENCYTRAALAIDFRNGVMLTPDDCEISPDIRAHQAETLPGVPPRKHDLAGLLA